MAKYLYPPGSKLNEMPTEETHIALPRDAAERAAWSEDAGYPVVGRAGGADNSVYLKREFVENYVNREVADWEGEAGL